MCYKSYLSPTLYNPFEQVTKSSFRELVESGYADFVLQHFEWPGVKEKTGFLFTPYDDKEAADQHAHQLGEKEGRTLQFVSENLEPFDACSPVEVIWDFGKKQWPIYF
ncbi:hypothetical protein [Sphingobacterium puteale]|uniref:hypothetical protein n=1 Tax=Sphingobacterium puteale TaxID=2420510 RepID=UPI0011C3691F|nr:hypothetical protein [Sphingobacterium puteale]